MVAKVTHGLKDFAQPFVVTDVVADEECVTHVGSRRSQEDRAMSAAGRSTREKIRRHFLEIDPKCGFGETANIFRLSYSILDEKVG